MAGQPNNLGPKRPCKFILQGEKCRFGRNCKFSHDIRKDTTRPDRGPSFNSPIASHSPTTPHSNYASPTQSASRENLDRALKDWRDLLPRGKKLLTFEAHKAQTQKFLEIGWTLVASGDLAAAQWVVNNLATEGGLRMIRPIECLENEASDLIAASTFKTITLPLFRIISHPHARSSLLLESSLDTLYNYLYGPSGRRSIYVFRSTVTVLCDLMSNTTTPSGEQHQGALTATLFVLDAICQLRQGASLLEELPPIVETLAACIPPEIVYHEARQLVTKIQRRLGVSDKILELTPRTTIQQALRPQFKFQREGPGKLSKEGPRHDNDHARITDIKILPTAEEIQSPRQEYLPSNDPSESHLPGLEGLLDRLFRLLRENYIGPLRDAVRIEIEKFCNPSPSHRTNQAAQTISHPNARIIRWEIDRRTGLELIVEFDQPPAVKAKLTPKEREQVWEETKQMQIDSMVCLVAASGKTIFFSVCDPKPTRPYERRQAQAGDEVEQQYSKKAAERAALEYSRRVEHTPSLNLDRNRAAVALSLIQYNDEDISWINFQTLPSPQLALVEFPGVLLPSFQPVLKALQAMTITLDVPFPHWIAHDTGNQDIVALEPPLYARKRGFSYDLGPLTNGTSFGFTPGLPFDYDALQAETTLDPAQQASVLHALSSELALIQGPPGTGKSYTGVALVKTLLKSAEDAALGPILIVCYTNHALDQFLESLVKSGVEQIVRIGSRSKSEVLEKLTLHHLTQEMDSTATERYEIGRLLHDLDEEIDMMAPILLRLSRAKSQENIRDYLEQHHPEHFTELFKSALDQDGFQLVKGRESDRLRDWLRGASHGRNIMPINGNISREQTVATPTRSIEQLKRTSLRSMNKAERRILYDSWVDEQAESLNEKHLEAVESYNEARAAADMCKQEKKVRCLLQAQIIGCTTTGLARNLDILRKIRSKVILVEEAAEVLEAHTLTAFLPSVEHAILIGDHEQLRPQINNYELQQDHPRGERYSLDVSLFERFVRPKYGAPELPYCSLKTQRRMHPSISQLIRSTLYPQLEDHDSVSQYPEVEGMRNRLYWLHHVEPEDRANPASTTNLSKSNQYEVEMVAALVTHLIRQGTYSSEDIAVLTPYLGQLRQIRQRLGSTFEIVIGEKDQEAMEAQGLKEVTTAEQLTQARKSSLLKALRLATVDNFQGEEAKVIIISLVRSNDERRCGFLKTSNRINVLLSRARHGMYIIGNSHTATSVKMWDDVVRIFEEHGNIGEKLALCCPRHQDKVIQVRTPDEFNLYSPEGGCNEKCNLRLQCGHACVNQCHSEALHKAVVCLERCPRLKQGCTHPCQKPCGEPCDHKCKTQMPSISLPCGHPSGTICCYEAQSPKTIKCKAMVEITIPSCKHKISVRCSELPLKDEYRCTAKCGAVLSCGHECKGKCEDCNTVRDGNLVATLHGECRTVCGRPYNICRHSCKSRCHGEEPCPLCEEQCEVRCNHSRCSKKCSEPCAPCVEDCTWSCPHRGRCQMACAVPCDLLPCSLRCEKTLSCSHRCPSVCGETCPDARYCQECADDSIKETMVDYIMQYSYADTDLNENPVIIPSCGHLLTVESMDGHMQLASFFELSLADPLHIEGLKPNPMPFEAADLKGCPLCRMPLRNINRYGRIVRRAFIDEATKKFIAWANSEFVPLAQRLASMEENLARAKELSKPIVLPRLDTATIQLKGPRDLQILKIKSIIGNQTPYKDFFQLRSKIRSFWKSVDEKEQPFSRVFDLVQGARDRGVCTNFEDAPEILQTRNRHLAIALLLRCDHLMLLEFLTLHKDRYAGQALGAARVLEVNFEENRKDCYNLLSESLERQQWANVVEGQLFWARFVVLERGVSPASQHMEALLVEARNHLTNARYMCTEYPNQTKGILAEVEEVEKMLRESTFYAPVTNAEKAAVYAAMASEFRGTGHWYYCENGHPFTVGECGMPMQTSVCPQCGAPVGGRDHRAVGGVTRAADFEARFRELHV